MSEERILIVDDEPGIRDPVSRLLQRQGFATETADGGEEALRKLDEFRPDLVLTDMRMPGMNGVELTAEIKRRRPDTAVIVMTGYASIETVTESLHLGVDDYLKKPLDRDHLFASIREALDERAVTMHNKKYVEDLERRLLHARKKPTAMLLATIRGLFHPQEKDPWHLSDTAESLARVLDANDPVTKDHSMQVGALVARMAELLSFPSQDVHQLYCAGLLHDVGKIALPHAVLCQVPEDMTEEDLRCYMEHPVISHRILQPVPEFGPILDTVLHHHERFDGKGYPDGLSGFSIPMGARMIAVADACAYIDVESAHDEFVHEASAIEYLMGERGARFDPDMVDLFLQMMQPVKG